MSTLGCNSDTEHQLRSITAAICALFPPARLLGPGGNEHWEGCRLRVSGVMESKQEQFREVLTAALLRAGYGFARLNMQQCLDRYLFTMDIVPALEGDLHESITGAAE